MVIQTLLLLELSLQWLYLQLCIYLIVEIFLKIEYVTLGINQRLPLYMYAFKTPNLFYINLAKIHRLITYAAQLSLFEYKKPQLGAHILDLGHFL